MSVSDAMKTAFMKAGYSANEIVVDNTLMIEKQKAKIASLPEYGKSDPRLPKVEKERQRFKARIKVFVLPSIFFLESVFMYEIVLFISRWRLIASIRRKHS